MLYHGAITILQRDYILLPHCFLTSLVHLVNARKFKCVCLRLCMRLWVNVKCACKWMCAFVCACVFACMCDCVRVPRRTRARAHTRIRARKCTYKRKREHAYLHKNSHTNTQIIIKILSFELTVFFRQSIYISKYNW